MARTRLVTVDVAAYLVGRGRDAVIKALQRKRLKKEYHLKMGESPTIKLLDLDEVQELWLEEGLISWVTRRYEDITQDYFVVTTDEGEWVIYPGPMDVYSGEILKQRLEAIRTKDEGESDGR